MNSKMQVDPLRRNSTIVLSIVLVTAFGTFSASEVSAQMTNAVQIPSGTQSVNGVDGQINQNGQLIQGSASHGVQYRPETQVHQVPLRIGGGDQIDVEVFNTPQLSGRFRVDQFGNINLSVGGTVQLAGTTPVEAARLIENSLKVERIMKDPHVSVFVSEYSTQTVTVLGEVNRKGTVALRGAETLSDILAAAGGVTATAGGTITIAHRSEPSQPLIIHIHTPNYSEIELTTMVLPGDTVVVSQAPMVYVLGSVSRQGAIPMPDGVPMTLLKLLALSSGISPVAHGSKSAIVRQTSGGVVTINVDIPSIMHFKKPDVVMEASDILVVPGSRLKELASTLLPSVATTAAGYAIGDIAVR